MNSNTEDQRFSRTEITLDEPHFDEEATLLAAQPVVPLDEVKSQGRSKSRLAVALAIVAGLAIGIIAATFIFPQRDPNPPPGVETSAVAPADLPAVDETQASAGGLTDESTKNENTLSDHEEPLVPAPQRNQPVGSEKSEPVLDAARPRPEIVQDPRDPDDEEIDRETRRAEKRAERRARRRAERQDRRERAQTTDDLLRIREIFEGAPRP